MSCAAVAAFEIANIFAGKTFYEVRVISERSGLARSSVGVAIETSGLSGTYDTLLVAGPTAIVRSGKRVLEYLQREAAKSRRVASICTGAFVLAEAGILDGRRATTRWLFTRDLQALYPKVRVQEDRILTRDGRVWTSAGMTAGIDLALALVEADLGVDIARQIAKGLVMYHRRGGAQGQESALLSMAAKSDRIQTALSYARQNLRSELSVEELAAAAHLSVRQFTRAFRQETGQSPAKAVEALRVEVADATGFGDRERMRRAFVRVVGRPPQELRRDTRDAGRRARRSSTSEARFS